MLAGAQLMGLIPIGYSQLISLLCTVISIVSNSREKKGSQQGHKMQHNDGKDSFLGSLLVLPVEL